MTWTRSRRMAIELAFEDRREIRSDKSGETYPQTAGGAGGTERNGGIE